MTNQPWAIITGASKGIGKAISWEFLSRNWNVVLVARSTEILEVLASEMRQKYHNSEIVVMTCDLTLQQDREQLIEKIAEEKIPISALVNNAGFGSAGPFLHLDRHWELKQIQLNIAALVDLTHLLLPTLKAQSQSFILNIASTAAFQPGPYMATYYATKAFVLHFSEALSVELSEHHISVTAHCPGATESEFAAVAGTDKALLGKPSFHTMSAETVARHAVSSMLSKKTVAIPGLMNRILAWSVRFTPRFLVLQITKRLNRPTI